MFLLFNFKISRQIRAIQPPGALITDLSWNPVIPTSLACVYGNGCLALFNLSAANLATAPECFTLPPAVGVTCVSWSPKGKQLVTGTLIVVLPKFKRKFKTFSKKYQLV